jgi:excisionase family DNA binding protein
MIESGESLLTVAEVADFLRLHPNTVRAKIAAGEIPCLRLGSGPMAPLRIPRDALEEKLTTMSPVSFPGDQPGARGRADESTSVAARGTNGTQPGRQ